MLSYILSFFTKKSENEFCDDDQESFLAEQLLELEFQSNDINEPEQQHSMNNITDSKCFKKTGLITYMSEDKSYVLIDGTLYYDITECPIKVNLNDEVLFLAYKDSHDSVTLVRILENKGLSWGDTDASEETNFKAFEHVIIGEVNYRKERYVYMKENNLKFNLDDVTAKFVPMKGDWLELNCSIQWDDNKPADITGAQVLKINSVKALRSKIMDTIVTEWHGESGTFNRQIFFNKQSLQNSLVPPVGSKAIVEAIESNQGVYAWRAINVIIESSSYSLPTSTTENSCEDEEESTLQNEKEKKINATYPLKFEDLNIRETEIIMMDIVNDSDQCYNIMKWVILGKKRDSQIQVKPYIKQPMKLMPRQKFSFTITCQPNFLGKSKECFIILFQGFQIKRFININVTDNILSGKSLKFTNNLTESSRNQIEKMINVRKTGDKNVVPGVKLMRPPNFIPVKLGIFPIPEKIWSAVLGDSDQIIDGKDMKRILDRLENHLPCLIHDLSISNYIDKWHTLLYMEEIQQNISFRTYDMHKAFLTQCSEYLTIDINGLSEKRPSLMKGDTVVAKNVWNTDSPFYQGYIHDIKGDRVFIKFNPQFHETYSGHDVSLEFHFSRSVFRRSHQAINLALCNLGPDVLFPKRINLKPLQISDEKLESIKWFNPHLNDGQKSAVKNILLGQCRPMPYCIYGPPGTGKTITVIETILQILALLPDSRILVATPSNSASNLITERLLGYRKSFSDSIIRLIARHLLDSDNIPNEIKPYCATLNIASENTSKSRYEVNKDGINLNCQSSFIGRHRVTIATCCCLGVLAQMGLPKGHFTHIIVDEAGQSTEPEIMIPLTFIDKDYGQIVLAGDPMQLGPVVVSKYCKAFGLDESFLNRLLCTFPYQQDFDAYKSGYNEKLVTKLNENYRSLEEVLTLPSNMFYGSSLKPNIMRNKDWILKITAVMSELFEKSDTNKGGIFVYGIRGINLRAEDSPSWFNPQEASMVAFTTCKLYKKNILPDDIGIITPYIAQVRYLRLLFEAMGLPQPKIGSVEEFQGQERPIIIISTVRSSESYIEEDKRNFLGFLNSPKRMNVALTRAQVAVLLFSNPHLLCRDLLWNRVICYAVESGNYMGCDLPTSIDNIN